MPKPRKRPDKLKCKPGFVQRGAACQKIKPKKGKLLAGLVTAGLVGAGAAAIASRRKSSQAPNSSPTAVIQSASSKLTDNKKVALITASVATAGLAGSVAAISRSPEAREALGQQVIFRQADAVSLLYKVEALKQDKETREANEKIREETLKKYPKSTPDGKYNLDTDSEAISKDLESLFQSNRMALKTEKSPKKRQKLLEQNQLIRTSIVLAKQGKKVIPDAVVVGYRDKDGKLTGTSATSPDSKKKALHFGMFLVANGSDPRAAVDFLKTTHEVSKNMGFNGRVIGEPLKNAEPLYKRYGGTKLPNSNLWIFSGIENKEREDTMNQAMKKKAITLENGNLLVAKPLYLDGELYGSRMTEVEPNSSEYKEWRGDSTVIIVNTRLDKQMPSRSKPQKAGYTWVEDPRAKGGGFWRKLRKGSGNSLAAKVAAGAIAAGAATAAVVANKKQLSDVATKAKDKALASLPDGGKKLSKQVQQKIEVAASAAESAIDEKIGKKKPSTAQQVAKEVAIELTSTFAARETGTLTGQVVRISSGNANVGALSGLAMGQAVKKSVRSALYERYGEGLKSEKGKRIVRGTVQLASLGLNVGMATAAARASSAANKQAGYDEEYVNKSREEARNYRKEKVTQPAKKEENWRDTLGVDKNASPAEIKKAYRELAKKYHPDVNPTPEAKAKMAKLNEAYEKLKKDSFAWESIERAYRDAWNAYPKMSIEFWTENL